MPFPLAPPQAKLRTNMAVWNRIRDAGRRLIGREADAPTVPPTDVLPDAGQQSGGEHGHGLPLNAPLAGEPPGPRPDSGEAGVGPRSDASRRGLKDWVEQRAERVVARVYETRAADIEERARRVVHSAYERSADDLEERAVRAMRRALEAEANRIKEAIEHSIAVKKREVRLSLLVLTVSSLLYLALYWVIHRAQAS